LLRTENKGPAVEQMAEPPGLVELTGFWLQMANKHLMHKVRRHLEAEGMTLRYFYALTAVAKQPGMSQQELSSHLGVDPTMMVAVVDDMEARGHVARSRSTKDRRRYVLTITASGQAEYSRQLDGMRQVEEEFFAPLRPSERASLGAALRVLAATPSSEAPPCDDDSHDQPRSR